MSTLHQVRSCITHWLDKVNAHSLHAPFLYDFYTQVVQTKKITEPHLRLPHFILRTIEHLELRHVLITGHHPNLISFLQKNSSASIQQASDESAVWSVLEHSIKNELITLNLAEIKCSDTLLTRILTRMPDKGVVILFSIHHTQANSRTWKACRQHELVYSSLDFYYFGLLFVDPTLTRQHFSVSLQS